MVGATSVQRREETPGDLLHWYRGRRVEISATRREENETEERLVCHILNRMPEICRPDLLRVER